jgi:hypothetical protein
MAMSTGWAAPTPENPFWRDADGRRTTVAAMLAGRDQATRRDLLDLHADAVCAIIHAAGRARIEGRDQHARSLATQASKLCGELAGLWPAGSHEPLT